MPSNRLVGVVRQEGGSGRSGSSYPFGDSPAGRGSRVWVRGFWRVLLATSVVALLVVAALAVAQSRGQRAQGEPDPVTWHSGVFPGNGLDTKAAQQFAAYRNRPLSIVSVFLGSRSWNDIFYSEWAFQRYAGYNVPMVVVVRPLTVQGTPLRAVADGSHDNAFRRFAWVLLAHGRGNSDIRLGWEFNRSTFPWSADNAAEYLAAFRHVSSLLKSLLPQATIDWNGGWGRQEAAQTRSRGFTRAIATLMSSAWMPTIMPSSRPIRPWRSKLWVNVALRAPRLGEVRGGASEEVCGPGMGTRCGWWWG